MEVDMKIGDLVRYNQSYHDIEGLFLVVEDLITSPNKAVKIQSIADGETHWTPSRYLEIA
jgi:HEPN domain-containing protein